MRFRNSEGRHVEYEAQLSATQSITLLTNILATLDSQQFEKTLDLREGEVKKRRLSQVISNGRYLTPLLDSA